MKRVSDCIQMIGHVHQIGDAHSVKRVSDVFQKRVALPITRISLFVSISK
jgi:hypothetical protein